MPDSRKARLPRIPRAFFSLILTVILAGSGLAVVSAQSEPYTPPASAWDGVTVAHPNGDVGDVDIQLVKVADGLYDPVNVASANDGTGRIFVVERFGQILIVDADGNLLETPFFDLSDNVITTGSEQGLLGLAFHPDYAENGLFYVLYTDLRTVGDEFLVEYSVSDDPNQADMDSGRVLFSIQDPYRNHNGGTIRFGPDGYLYISVGDGGLAGDPYQNAQDLHSPMGKILRIDVDATDSSAYGIPEDNPFNNGAGLVNLGGDFQNGVLQSQTANQIAQVGAYRPDALPEIYYFGLRNAWQFSFDSATGDVYIADVGQVNWEEINFIPAGSPGGLNFGWNFMESGHCYPPEAGAAEYGDVSNAAVYGTLDGCSLVGVPPVAEYDHVTGCSITGVGVYRGEAYPTLDGIYFSADYCTGRVFGLVRDDTDTWQFEELLQADAYFTGSGEGEDGTLYVTSYAADFPSDGDPAETPRGSLWMIVSADQVPDGAEVVPLLEAEEEPTPTTVPETTEATPSA